MWRLRSAATWSTGRSLLAASSATARSARNRNPAAFPGRPGHLAGVGADRSPRWRAALDPGPSLRGLRCGPERRGERVHQSACGQRGCAGTGLDPALNRRLRGSVLVGQGRQRGGGHYGSLSSSGWMAVHWRHWPMNADWRDSMGNPYWPRIALWRALKRMPGISVTSRRIRAAEREADSRATASRPEPMLPAGDIHDHEAVNFLPTFTECHRRA
jgi:hypothetical protein